MLFFGTKIDIFNRKNIYDINTCRKLNIWSFEACQDNKMAYISNRIYINMYVTPSIDKNY